MTSFKGQFFAFADAISRECRDGEVLLCYLAAERSDFIRFNHARVRQAGTVEQRFLTLRLVHWRRQASATLSLTGDAGDLTLARNALGRLRESVAQLPEDPWLLIAETVTSTTSERRGELPAADTVIEQITRAKHDLVGFYAGGTICRGFANSLGQRNWHEVDTFNLEWSLYLRADKAVKDGYAGTHWNGATFEEKLAASAERLAYLEKPPRTLEPGEYRAYLTPRAMEEVVALLNWSAWSAKARETRQSALLKLEHGERLSPKLSAAENTESGVAPHFQRDGFVKPARVDLIRSGALGDPLVSPRSSKEYARPANAANASESPESFDMAGGGLAVRDALAALDTGLYVSNLWYLNYSDRPAGRITGMTRFATMWVEHGKIVAPVNAIRFDDTIYRMLGENLIDLTDAPELMLDNWTYEERTTSSVRLPGALLGAMRFTL